MSSKLAWHCAKQGHWTKQSWAHLKSLDLLTSLDICDVVCFMLEMFVTKNPKGLATKAKVEGTSLPPSLYTSGWGEVREGGGNKSDGCGQHFGDEGGG